MSLLTDLTAVLVPAAPFTPPVAATLVMAFGGSPTGGATVGFTIDGGTPIIIAPAAAEPAEDMATALAIEINGEGTYTAVADLGQINMVDNSMGIVGNSRVILDASTDLTCDTTVISGPEGGVDAAGGFGTPAYASITSVDVPAISGFLFPVNVLNGGGSAQLHRELKKMGWTLDGPDAGKVMRKSHAIAAHVLSQI